MGMGEKPFISGFLACVQNCSSLQQIQRHTHSTRCISPYAGWRSDMPKGEFMDGWNIVRPGGAKRLEKTIRKCRWHSIRIADESLRSGVGESSEQAIACALQLAVRSFSQYFNAAEVRHIHLTRYPWFVLGGVGVYPYRIQESPVQFVSDDALPLPVTVRRRELPANASWLFPQPGSTVPMLQETPTLSRSRFARTQ